MRVVQEHPGTCALMPSAGSPKRAVGTQGSSCSPSVCALRTSALQGAHRQAGRGNGEPQLGHQAGLGAKLRGHVKAVCAWSE